MRRCAMTWSDDMDNRSGTARAVQAAAAGWGAILRRREPRRRPAPRPRRTLFSVLAGGMVALGLPLLAVSPASAHTPAVSATCADGITVTGTGYEAGNTNTLGIQLDGGTWVTKTFATSDSLHVAVPQND